MPNAAIATGQLSCPMAGPPLPMNVLPTEGVLTERGPVATMMDNATALNIPIFPPKCNIPPFPITPCAPTAPAPWKPTDYIFINFKNAKPDDSFTMCVKGGKIAPIGGTHCDYVNYE